MTSFIFVLILITHWLADFVFQDDETAKGKSTKLSSLFFHAFCYTVVWIIPIFAIGVIYTPDNGTILLFLPITFLSHALIDYYTSKTHSQLFVAGKHHAFFTSIGLDQVLHYLQLWFTIQMFL